jgi:hypothetical protein
MSMRAIHRVADIIIGIPFLLVGACGLLLDLISLIFNIKGWGPNSHPTSTIPMGTILGFPLVWFGHRLVFRSSRVKPIAADTSRPPDSN